MPTGTMIPYVPEQFLDNSGNPLNAGTIDTFEAGTSTALATYSDVALAVPNANPIVLDSAGRATIFLDPTKAYKFVIKTSAGVTIRTRDNIHPYQSGAVAEPTDVTVTAGEALADRDLVYLSDGSGALTAGRWYKADADNLYSSVNAVAIGVAIGAIASGASGTVRLLGRVTGLSGLTAGLTFYVSGTAGALTSTAPGNVRVVGVAESTTVLILRPNPLSTMNFSDQVVQRPEIKDYSETRTAPTIAAGVLTLDLETGNVFDVSLNANITTVTISNPPATGKLGSFTLILTADGTQRTITWPAAVKWPGGSAPTPTATSGKKDVFVFMTPDAGTTWLAAVFGQNH